MVLQPDVGTVLPDFIREKTKFDSLCQLFTLRYYNDRSINFLTIRLNWML